MKGKEFAKKLVIITGGSSGLGKALAERLITKRANLALVARNEKKLSAVREELLKKSQAGQKIESYPCDVSNFNEVEIAFKKIVETLGLPDILINSAGILREGYFEKVPLEIFQEVMAIDFFGALHCIKAVLPFFQIKGAGTIVNISSMAGLMGGFGYSAYCSAKFALNGLTETLRQELKPQGIKFHLVCPPEFESPMVEELNTYRSLENKKMVHTLPVLDAEQVADAVMRGIEKGKYMIIPGLLTRTIERANRWFPGLARVVADIRLKKFYQGPN